MSRGKVFCDPNGMKQLTTCGEFEIINGRIIVTYKTYNQAREVVDAKVDAGKYKPRPKTVTETSSTSENGETTRTLRTQSIKSIDSGLYNDYPPRTPRFTRSTRDSLNYTNLNWLNLSILEQARYLFGKYSTITHLHGFRYSSELLVCKAYRESLGKYNGRKVFQTQKTTSVRRSTASGVSQVTRGTAKDQFLRGPWFQSKIPGFESIRDGHVFHDRMAGNMVAQMELGVAILEQKRRDGGFRSDQSILASYYGSGSKYCNTDYATRVLKCESCMQQSGISEPCLDRALGKKGGC